MLSRATAPELAIPKLRQGSYYPKWLLERRCRQNGRWRLCVREPVPIPEAAKDTNAAASRQTLSITVA
jgi:hypothetical protein